VTTRIVTVAANNMKFTVDHDGVPGSGLVGFVETTYAKLVKCFGEPAPGAEWKVTAEWRIEFEDGTVASIYDWKVQKTPKQTYDWHVGGNGKAAVLRVAEALGLPEDSYEFS
jgi:hypothetical protein